jgi:two-component system autoinducer 2 sensor kinase/phosphatase LuxQ
MGDNKVTSSRLSMANLTVRLIFIVFSVLMATLLLFSYQYSSSAVNQEVERSLKQTASLIQNLFDYNLASMQALQNSQAKSATLLAYVTFNTKDGIDNYFIAAEKADLSSAPDFRFIVKGNELFWEDGNSPFFGIGRDQLIRFSYDIAFNNSWHYSSIDSDIGKTHLLLRKTPMVDDLTGEVVGRMFIGVVLDNNYALVDHLRVASNSQHVVLVAGGEPVASTLTADSELYKNIFDKRSAGQNMFGDYLYSEMVLTLAGVETPLSVYSVQGNQNILSLEKNFRLGFIFSVIAIVAAAIFARLLIQKRIAGELGKLMSYTLNARDTGKSEPFEGSFVYEFDHIGRTLEHTFESLIEKEQSFQDLFRFAVSPIIVWDSALNITRMNPAAEKAFEKADIFSGAAFDDFQNRIKQQLIMARAGETLTGINENISDTVFRWNISPVVLDNGVYCIIGQGLDITTLVEAEKQSNLAREEAEKSANARADFLAKMSHEIRTPLNGILGISNLLDKSLTEPEQKEKVQVLLHSGEHLLAVLNDILDFSKIEQGQFKIVYNEFALTNVIDSIENIYRPLCADKGIQLKMSANFTSDTYIRTDQVRLNQIMFNLLSNAVKFTHVGHIKTLFDMGSQKPGKSYLHIIIQDTGIGISQDNLKHIFDPFVQSEKTTIREYGGSGLGLTIVKNLVDMLDGSIDIDSSEGQGTEIRIKLPVEIISADQVVSKVENSALSDGFFSRPLTTLLVEDNQTNAFIAKTFCEKYGMRVDWAKDGFEALDILKDSRYDLILMDNQMPNLDGVEATQRIRAMGIETPVFAFTADGYEETRQAFLSSGADYVLVKPVREENFQQALHYYRSHFKR